MSIQEQIEEIETLVEKIQSNTDPIEDQIKDYGKVLKLISKTQQKCEQMKSKIQEVHNEHS